MFKNWKSLFIVQEEDNSSNNDASISSTGDAPILDDESTQELLEELEAFDDFDAKLNAALEGEVLNEEGVVDNNVLDYLLAEVEKSNLDGFDYFEYKQSLKAMGKMMIDEETMFKTAFATAQTIGVTVDQLLNSAEHYLNILDQQDLAFKDSLDLDKKNLVGDKEATVDDLGKTIKEHQEKIKQLKEEITKHENRILELEREIKIDSAKIETQRNNFNASFHFLRAQFSDDIAKMKKYLK